MGVCSMWILMVLCILSTLHSVDTSVNTCRLPNVKNTTQSSDHGSKKYLSYRAVDGCTKQDFSEPLCCSLTAAYLSEAWWQVDLEGPTVVDYVKIYYRDEGYQQKQRFVGYQLYVSNTSNWRDGYRCFADETSNGNKLSLTPKIRCNGIAEYLTIYSDRRSHRRKYWYSKQAILELCEVEVYGCPLGKYGNGTCDEDCATGCASSVCDPVTGRCASCTPGYHGNHCDQNCPANCKDNRCIQSKGTCEDCEDGFYGLSCDDCSVGCTNLACDKKSGNCSPCKPGYYGDFCNITCPSNCEGDVCNQISGICTACNAGYYGSRCDQTCPFKCKDNRCEQNDGDCKGCEKQYHGSNCSLSCPKNCKDQICMQENGQCTVMIEVNFKPAAIGIGIGCGVVIVALVIVIIVQARRLHSGGQRDTARSTTNTDISLQPIGQEQRTETGTYEVIDAEQREQSTTNTSPTDNNYERLGKREKEEPHIYEHP